MAILLRMFWNYRMSIPAWLLLAAHFLFDVPLWLFFLALAFWVVYAVVMTLLLCWVRRCGSEPTPPRKDINPYAAKTEDYLPKS